MVLWTTKIWKLLVQASKHSVLYNLSISTFLSKWLLWDFFGLFVFTDATNSQIKAWNSSVRVSKDSPPFNPSTLALGSKRFLWDEFVDLRTAAPKSQIKAWKVSVKVSKRSMTYDPLTFSSITPLLSHIPNMRYWDSKKNLQIYLPFLFIFWITLLEYTVFFVKRELWDLGLVISLIQKLCCLLSLIDFSFQSS